MKYGSNSWMTDSYLMMDARRAETARTQVTRSAAAATTDAAASREAEGGVCLEADPAAAALKTAVTLGAMFWRGVGGGTEGVAGTRMN